MRKPVYLIYRKLFKYFGPQYWWPADSPFEVIIGAILTQNTSWQNVEKAIINLKKDRLLSAKKLYSLPAEELAKRIRPAGYYNIKAKRVKAFLTFFFQNYRGNIKRISAANTKKLRQELLDVNGIGKETADSILLYALNKPVFVVDAYTKRILARHHFIKEDADYDKVQGIFRQNLKTDIRLFNEYHALLVKLGKDFCLKRRPKCDTCPLKRQKTKGKRQNLTSRSKTLNS
ncbi:MAG: endonuclease III domain-containing protein [Candidatus Omnitrophica bacterium]|nr:endonuclease III domain-containing protein [Candidatus Omnitrophota bacterium]